jgi:hypothetical protein
MRKTQIRARDRATYRIVVQGNLDAGYSDRMQGMAIVAGHDADQNPIATLTGELIDQAALISVLSSLYDLHLPLLRIECLGASLSGLQSNK